MELTVAPFQSFRYRSGPGCVPVVLRSSVVQVVKLTADGTVLVNRLEDYASPVNVWLHVGKLTALDMTLFGWLGRKTSTQTNKYPDQGWLEFIKYWEEFFFFFFRLLITGTLAQFELVNLYCHAYKWLSVINSIPAATWDSPPPTTRTQISLRIRSLIRVFVVRMNKLWLSKMRSDDSDQSARLYFLTLQFILVTDMEHARTEHHENMPI